MARKTFVLTKSYGSKSYVLDKGMWKVRVAHETFPAGTFICSDSQPHQNWDLDKSKAKRKMVRTFNIFGPNEKKVWTFNLDWNELKSIVRVATPSECETYIDHVVSEEINSLW